MIKDVYDIANCGPRNQFIANDKIVSNCNFQNFKQSQKEGGNLRSCIKAPAGYQMVVVDAAQIEARIVAWLAEEEWVLEAFREKRDLYCEFGNDVYGRTITKADVEERFVCKTAILGLGFNMGGPKLQHTLMTQSINQGMDPIRLPLEVCYSVVNAYRNKCRKIKDLWKEANDSWIGAMLTGKKIEYKGLVFEKNRVRMPNGLYLQYPELKAQLLNTGGNKMFSSAASKSTVSDASYLSARSRTKIYGGLLIENIVQCLARIIVAWVMIEIAKKYRIVMTTHDEIVFLAKTKEAKVALAWAIELMSKAVVWAPDLPLSAEGKYDVCYSK